MSEQSPFSPAALQAQVDKLLADVPPGRRVALLGWVDTSGRWRITGRAHLGDGGHWVLQGDLSGRGSDDVTGAVSVLASW